HGETVRGGLPQEPEGRRGAVRQRGSLTIHTFEHRRWIVIGDGPPAKHGGKASPTALRAWRWARKGAPALRLRPLPRRPPPPVSPSRSGRQTAKMSSMPASAACVDACPIMGTKSRNHPYSLLGQR